MLSKLAITMTVAVFGVGGSPSQSLGQVCPATPQAYDSAASKGNMLVKESTPGREKLRIKFKGLWVVPDVSDFGDPVTGTTSYIICIYDDADVLVAQMEVDRAQQDCGTPPRPCWRTIRKGYRYRDNEASADGIEQIVMKTKRDGIGFGRLMSSRLIIKGNNNPAKGQTSLPTGIAAALQDNTNPTVQVVTSDGYCFELGIFRVIKADGLLFKGVGFLD